MTDQRQQLAEISELAIQTVKEDMDIYTHTQGREFVHLLWRTGQN